MASAIIGALPVGAGQHRLVRPIYERRLRHLPETPVLARMRSGATLVLDLSDYAQAQAYLSRRYDEALTMFVRSRLPAAGTYVDVGAHIGFVAIAAALAKPRARVVAIEPHPANAARLRKNLALNPAARVTLEQAAAGRRAGTAQLTSEGEGTDFHRIVAGGSSAGTVEVPVLTLDELAERRAIDRIDVLKLDVEGYEPEALAGAERLLAGGRIGTIICELNDKLLARVGWDAQRLEQHLRERGYVRERIPPVGLHRLHRPSVPYENFAFTLRP